MLEAQQLLESEVKDQTHEKTIDGWLAKTGGYAKDMTARDYFAAKAMQELIAGGSANVQEVSQAAYIVADAMLKARAA